MNSETEDRKTEDRREEAAARTAGAAISRMPRKVRDEVSQAIEDGATWREVAAICERHGFAGIQPMNVTNYRKGAHLDWVKREAHIEALRRDSETTSAVMDHYVRNGGSPAEAGLLTAAEMMSRALANMGQESWEVLIADDPKTALGITRELARVADLLEKKKATATLEKAAATPEEKPTMTPEQRAAALKEIFGLPPG